MRADRPALAGLLMALAAVGCAGGLRFDFASRRLAEAQGAVPAADAVPGAELPPPPGLAAASGELRAVPLTWDPLLVGDVGGYVVERAPAADGPFVRLAVVPGRFATLYRDGGGDAQGALPDAFTAWYRLRAYTETGRLGREASAAVSATTAAPPAPPRDLRAFSLQPRVVPLSWRVSEDPTVGSYVLYRSPASQGPYEPVAVLQGRDRAAYADAGLGELRVFYYRVAARNRAGGEGPPSEPVRAVTKPEPLPPVDLRKLEATLGANRVEWEPNVERDIVEYRLLRLRQHEDSASLVTVVGPAETSATDRDVAARERVTYTLVAVDRDGLHSGASLPLFVESEGYALGASLQPDGVQLTWNPREDEGHTGARIFRGGRLTRRELAVVSGASYVDRDVKPGRRYRYVVVLDRADGQSAPPSEAVEIAIPGD